MKIKNEYNKSIDLIKEINQLIGQSKVSINEANNIIIKMDNRTERILQKYDGQGRH